MEFYKEKLLKYNQEHLVQFWNELTETERKALEQDLSELDLAEVIECYNRAALSSSKTQELLDDKVRPIPEEKVASVKSSTKEELENYEMLGLQEVADGRAAVLVMAGGQGTRLGVSYPKGMYDVGLPSHKTLFQLQAERILCLQNLAKEKCGKFGYITWYILTSEATNDTLTFLRKNDYFGLKPENVVAFKQGMLPCFTFDGKIILNEKYEASKAPDGNGGLYRALKVEGILQDMMKRGIRSVHAHSVDNILIKVADPLFFGYCLASSADCGVKVIEKTSPHEPVGVVCKVEDEYRVVEYSEIAKETAELRDANGELVYHAANICNHYFTVDFLSTVANFHETQLELHVAKKKIPYINNDGEKIRPSSPNGIKIEKFVFDVFKFAKNFAVWQGVREEEFSPLKNADSAGQDCPSSARNDVLKLHKKWLMSAGVKAIEGDVEVSPLLSYAGENLHHLEGQVLSGPCVINSLIDTVRES